MNSRNLGKSHVFLFCISFLSLCLIFTALKTEIVRADHTPNPTSVTIAGSFQSELGCPGDWQPECSATHLIYDSSDDVWQATFSIPGGSWEYKAALNNSWDENYGANAQPGGSNIGLTLGGEINVKFYYDHKSHWITDNQNSRIVTAPGSYQSELGCPGDWQPDCLRSWLQDPDGDGTYTFSTTDIPAGSYEFKAAVEFGGNQPDNYRQYQQQRQQVEYHALHEYGGQ